MPKLSSVGHGAGQLIYQKKNEKKMVIYTETKCKRIFVTTQKDTSNTAKGFMYWQSQTTQQNL